MVSPQAAASHTEPEPLFADVIVPRHLAGPFTYIVPLTLQPTIRIGHRVLVPFGRSLLQGAVIALSPTLPQSLDRAHIKEIRSLIQEEDPADVSSRLFQLSRQVAEQYVAPWGQCLRLMLPPAPKKRARDQPLISTAPFVQSVRQTDQSNPSVMAPFIPDTSISWAGPLFEALKGQGPSRILVQAPWGGRLRLLQDAIRLTLDQSKSALIIVGEAERAQWIRDSICDHETGISAVCFHSGLSDHVKAEIWDRIHRQMVRVVVGTRSAIFLPLAAIGVIWVEGEEDAALKEVREPRYHARDVAWLRVQDEQAVLVLSSSHPSLETRAAVGQRGAVVRQSIPLEERPNVQVVDLRDHGHSAVLSQPLAQAIEQAISRRAGVLLFLNRKGYAGALVCRDCGLVPRCPACRVALMYSRQAGRLRCSYCGSSAPTPETCVSCSGPRMQLIGEGTERVEEDANRLFPRAVVIRLDGDTMRRPAQAEALWRKIEQGDWDIVVGTQLLLRRMALPRMGLVGIVQADAGLSMPDFRSAERTYHLLLDAISLAESATNGGQVIVQTYLSSHHAIQAVAQNEESIFLREELSYRQALGYPPTVYLIALLVSGSDEKMVRAAAAAWVVRLTACYAPSVARPVAADNAPSTAESISQPDRLTVLGPVPSPVSRLRGRYRWQILVKSLEREVGVEAVRVTVKDMERIYQRRSVKFDIDVDPIEEW